MQTTRLTPDEVNSLYQKHGATLAGYACSCGLDHALAEDVVHQLFLKMLGEKAFVPQAPVAYLFRATRNACLNLRRDRSRETELPDTEPWLIHSRGGQDEALILQKALQELPEEQRETVFLKIWSGMTLQEIFAASGSGRPVDICVGGKKCALTAFADSYIRNPKGAFERHPKEAGFDDLECIARGWIQLGGGMGTGRADAGAVPCRIENLCKSRNNIRICHGRAISGRGKGS